MRGRATSSVTLPPPAGSTRRPLSKVRSYTALTSCTVGSVSSGPSKPVTYDASNSWRSASMNTRTSPLVAARDRHITSPLPGRDGTLRSTSSRCTTRAPAALATSAVRSVDPESMTTTSSTSQCGRRAERDEPPSSMTMDETIAPIVDSSSSAGRTTLTVNPPLRTNNSSTGQSAERELPCSSQRSTVSLTGPPQIGSPHRTGTCHFGRLATRTRRPAGWFGPLQFRPRGRTASPRSLPGAT